LERCQLIGIAWLLDPQWIRHGKRQRCLSRGWIALHRPHCKTDEEYDGCRKQEANGIDNDPQALQALFSELFTL
jgi:hypothetical protein